MTVKVREDGRVVNVQALIAARSAEWGKLTPQP